jgi:hypothetical protein
MHPEALSRQVLLARFAPNIAKFNARYNWSYQRMNFLQRVDMLIEQED